MTRALAALWALGFAASGVFTAVEARLGEERGWIVGRLGTAIAREWQ